MVRTCTLAILSDIHYASAAEQARGPDYELVGVRNPLWRLFIRSYRRFIWLRDPLHQNHLLEEFCEAARGVDYVVANGDYSCNTASVGLSDSASCQSAGQCLARLRHHFAPRLRFTYGDHELGKLSFVGGRGGMRLASWRCAQENLGLEPFWQVALGKYLLVGLVSSLVALPVFEPEILPEEKAEWQRLRTEHLAQITQAFAALKPDQRVLLFCHDPTALPFLWREPSIYQRLPQLEQTIIGHLHSNLVLWKSRRLAGMPRIDFLGHTPKRLSAALREARHWSAFRVRLCPSLAGIELLKDGGFLTASLDLEARRPALFQFHPLYR
jgi:hypothetical protein